MKSKLKNFSLLFLLLILFLASIFGIFALSSCSTHKTILSANYNDDLTLNKDYYLDNNGNLVSDNLFSGNGKFIGDFYLPYYSQYVDSGTYTLSNFPEFASVKDSNGVNTIASSSYGSSLTFTISSSGYYRFYFSGSNTNLDVANTFKIMLNVGSVALSYEPYGVWYYGTNLNNPFYNSSLYYYFNLSTNVYGYDIFLDDSLLNGNTFIYPYRALQVKYSSEDLRAYIEDTQLGYWRLDFAKPYPVSMLNFKVLCNTTSNFDYCITYYFNDGSNYVYHNNISSSLTEFIIDLSEVSNLSDKECVFMTWRRQYSYEINCLSMANYELGFIDGSNEGYNKALKELDIDSYKTQINNLEQEITDLEYSLERAQERAQNSLDHLTYNMIGAVMSTPFNILHDYLNWNFFGVNLFSLFTSLVTLLLIIWVIKFLLGRK